MRMLAERLGLAPGFVFTLIILLTVTALALLAPWLPLLPYTKMSAARLLPPSMDAWFGTDQFGRDIFVRTLWGLRVSIIVAGAAVATSLIVGVPLGLIAAYFGRWPDSIIMRALDALLAFPSLLLAIGVAAIIGPGAISAAIALGIVGIPQMARIVRGAALAEKEGLYIDAARVTGVGSPGIMIRHLLPNLTAPIMVQATLYFAVAILTEAGLSFIGLGVQVPLPSLGAMLSDSRAYTNSAPWYALAPGLTITLFVLALNAAADGLRDRLDPLR